MLMKGPLSDPGRRPTRDHDIPKCRGGALGATNQVLSCQRCNSAKSDMTGEKFIAFRKTSKFPDSYVAWLESKRIALLD
jgi:hypothetical protein